MINKRIFLIATGLAILLIALGCSAPLPTPTPVVDRPVTIEPTPTSPPSRPTATPLATPLPTSTVRPLPRPGPSPTPVAGYYRNPSLGISLIYPVSWRIEITDSNFPDTVFYDDNDPVRLLLFSDLYDDSQSTVDFARFVATSFSGTETIEFVDEVQGADSRGEATWMGNFTWVEQIDDQDEPFAGRLFVTRANNSWVGLLLTGRPEIVASRPETFGTIVHSLTIEQPEFFGVSRENGLVLLSEEPSSLDPLESGSSGDLNAYLFSGLVALAPDMTVSPSLAERWEIVDGGRQLRFVLHPDLTFHSGEPLDAAAVVASLQRAQNSGSPETQFAFGDIEEIVAEGTQTILITLDGPKPYVLYKLTLPAAAVVNSAQALADDPEWWRRPDGSGPFSLRRWTPGEAIILDKFSGHPHPPSVAAVLFLPFGPHGVSLFETGMIDAVGVSPFNLARVLDPTDPLSANLVTQATLCTTVITLDTQSPPLNEPGVRAALALAINRVQLAEVALKGSARPAAGFMPPGLPGYRARAPLSDPDLARALLKSPISRSLVLAIPAENRNDGLTDAVIDMWQTTLGVNVEINLLEIGIRPDPADFDLLLDSLCAPYPDPEGFLTRYFSPNTQLNRSGIADDPFNELLNLGGVETDPIVRIAYYQQAEDLLLDLWPVIPLVHPNRYLLVHSYIEGFDPSLIARPWARDVALNR